MLAEVVISHEERAVVRLGDVFVKVDGNEDRVGRELAALQGAAIARPEVLWHRSGDVHLLAVSALEGSPLGVLGHPSTRPPAAWESAGSVARALHRQPVPAGLAKPSRYLLEDLDELERWVLSHDLAQRAVVVEHARRARAARDSATTEAFVHGDFQPAHVFVTDDNKVAGVIDWGDAGMGDPHYDLAVLTLGHTERLEALIAGYAADVDVERIRGYWSWRRLGSVRWMIEHGFDASGDVTALALLS